MRFLHFFLIPKAFNVKLCPSFVSISAESISWSGNRDYDAEDNEVRISSVVISVESSGIKFEEIQAYEGSHGRDGNYQHDEGYVFRYGSNLFFLTKSIKGTAVKLGGIEHFEPSLGHLAPDQGVEFFQGYIYVASDRGFFERTRFFCRRYSEEVHPLESGIMTISVLSDVRAKKYILADWS
jgi:hypothetical protein